MSGVTSNTARKIRKGGTLPATCSPGELFLKTGASAGLYSCAVANTWVGPFAAGGGGSTGTVGNLLLSSTSVDLNEGTSAKQALYTCPASRRCVITNIVMQKFSAGVGEPLVFTVGWNAGANDVIQGYDFALFSGPITTQALYPLVYDAGASNSAFHSTAVIGVAADVLGLKVAVPFGSALSARCDIFGYLTLVDGTPAANVTVP